MVKKIFASLMVICFYASLASAADQIRQKGQKQDQKRDGSCGIIQVDDGQNQSLAASQTRTRNPIRDRKKDGSCQTTLTQDHGIYLSADQIRKRSPIKDQKRDGSCS